jgi:RES domain-containing protein
LIEVLANLKGDPNLFPDAYQLIKITVPEQIAATALDLNRLSDNWRDDLVQTRSIGDSWLASGQSGLLAVPSVPSPESMNYLLNPLHQDAKEVKIEWCKWVKYDQRLFHLSGTKG